MATEGLMAEKHLDQAISDAVAEEHPGHVMTGWVVMAAVVGSDGQESSGITWFVPKGQHWTQLLGLVEAGRLRLQANYLGEFSDDD